MFGLCDIPCVSVFLDKVSEYTVAALFRGLKYIFCYTALVDELNSETEKLNIEEGNMSREVKKEAQSGKIIKDYVSKWQVEAEKIQKSGEELSPSCSCIPCLPIPDPISRFQIGRSAVKKAERVTKLTISGKEHLTGGIAYLPEVTFMPHPETIFEEFQSRIDVYKKLWDALVDEDSPLIHGIYGMAGVGKTRIMEQFWEDAVKKKIFSKVIRVNVGSENTDKIKLQQQIAGLLGCGLESEVMERRASQLENSLRNGDKILLLLDDVWRDIQLDDIIGTPFADGSSSSNGSKILLTSRKNEVCLNNKCKHVIEIQTLRPNEALYLFKKTLGPESINSLQDESLVQKVCDKCGELPLLIHAVGKALKGKPPYLWMDAHDQLEKGQFEEIPDVDPQVYTGIKLSIDYLQNKDAKSCLFLCSMFPEDSTIDMKTLIHLATGSELIPAGESRIRAMIDYLKISSLLLSSGEDNETKVHDIIRSVARSVALTDSEYAFLQVTCNSGNLPSNANYRTRKFLCLEVETADVHFNENLVCLDLHTLWLQSNDHPQQFSGGFFSMFVNLGFLMLQSVKLSLQPFSLQPLANLGTLTLLKCDMRNTDVSLFPKNLKTLCISFCTLPRPLEIANLKYLRKLEIEQWDPKLVMMSNAIPTLSKLEELHIPGGFILDLLEYRMEPVVMEISKLTHLKSLRFQFYGDGTFEGTDIFSNIDIYNIVVGDVRHSGKVSSTRSIGVYGKRWQPWEGLIARAEEVGLGTSDVEVSNLCGGYGRDLEDLKKLYIYRCENMGHLASISQDEIQSSLQLATCFSKLTSLEINSCSKMKYLFCDNIAISLVQLQELSVKYCDSMEAIIMNEGTGDREIITFPKLKRLVIVYMKRLASFYVENFSNPSAQYLPLFDVMVAFRSLEELQIVSLPDISDIWGKECYNDTTSSFCKLTHLSVSLCDKLETVISQAMLHRLHNLEVVHVSACSSLRTMIPPSVASDLKHLKKITIRFCGEMRDIIEAGEQLITDGILFPELTVLELVGLPSLKSFWCFLSGNADPCKVAFTFLQLSSIVLKDLPVLKSFLHGENFEFHMPALKEVDVNSCGLSTLFTFSMFRKFQLETLKVKNCKLLEKIVEDLRGDETSDKTITLSRLAEVSLEKLPNLKSFFHNANYEFHMPVIKKVLVHACGLSNALFTRPVFKNLKQLEEFSVCDCEMLEGIFEDVRGDENDLDTSDKIITLNRVSVILLQSLPRVKSIFYGATYELYMPALREVKILECGISILFTCPVFREIRQLRQIHVSNCDSLEHVVEEVGGDETCEINGKIIRSSQLASIILSSLPNLKGFSCSRSYVFKMPKLQYFTLKECPKIEYFSSSNTKAPLVHVNRDWDGEEAFTDVNDYVRQITKVEATQVTWSRNF